MVATAQRIDDCLSIADGRLWIEGCDATELAERFGTPLSVISEDQLRRNARRFKRALADAWPEGETRVLPSIKANYTLALRCALTQEGLGCDVFGPAELHAALRGGVPPQLISVNGTGKTRALLEQAVRIGARVTLDSVREIDLVREVARALGLRAQVRFRARPRYLELQAPSDFSESSVYETAQEYKPGIPTDELIAAGREAVTAPELDVLGLMSTSAGTATTGRHGLRMRRAPARPPRSWWRRGMAGSRASSIWAEAIAVAARSEHLGLRRRRRPVPRARARGRRPGARGGPARGLAGRVPLDGVALEIEPGRALHADTGIHLTRVVNLKAAARAARVALGRDRHDRDVPARPAGEHCRFPVVSATACASRRPSPWTSWAARAASTCWRRRCGCPRSIGDTLAFLDTGAYEDACAANFNALPRPAIVLVAAAKPRSSAAPRRSRMSSRATSCRSGCGHDRARHSTTPASRSRSIDAALRLLSRPARPAPDRRGRRRGPRARRDHRPPGRAPALRRLDLGGGQVLELLEYLGRRFVPRASAPATRGPRISPCASTASMPCAQRLVAAGVRIAAAPPTITAPGDWHGVRCVYVDDPDGRTVELVQRP